MGGSLFGVSTIADTSSFPAREPRSLEDASEDFKLPKHKESLHSVSSAESLLLLHAVAQLKGSAIQHKVGY